MPHLSAYYTPDHNVTVTILKYIWSIWINIETMKPTSISEIYKAMYHNGSYEC